MPPNRAVVAGELDDEGRRSQGREEQRREARGHAAGGGIGVHAAAGASAAACASGRAFACARAPNRAVTAVRATCAVGMAFALPNPRHGPQIQRARDKVAQRGPHVQGGRLLAHRGASENRNRRAEQNARGERGRDGAIGADIVYHRVRRDVQRKLQGAVQQKARHRENGQKVQQPAMGANEIVGPADNEAQHHRGRRPHDTDGHDEHPVAQHLRSRCPFHRMPPRSHASEPYGTTLDDLSHS